MTRIAMAAVDSNSTWIKATGPHIIRKNSTTLYEFYLGLSAILFYKKSTDNGFSWGPVITLKTGTVSQFSIWYDKWTPGDTGTKIHFWYLNTAADDVFYRTLDISTDTLSTEVVVFNGASFNVITSYVSVRGIKAVGGNLYVKFDGDSGTETGFYRSINAGAAWTSRTYLATLNEFYLVPGNESDNQDIYAIWIDAANDILKISVYDDSANSWSTTNIQTSFVDTPSFSGHFPKFAVVNRHSDNHLIVVGWNTESVGTSNLKCWDINGSGSIVAKTNVITNNSGPVSCAIAIDKNTDRIRVYYIGSESGLQAGVGNDVKIYSKDSTDGAVTWSVEHELDVLSQDYRNIFCDLLLSDHTITMRNSESTDPLQYVWVPATNPTMQSALAFVT